MTVEVKIAFASIAEAAAFMSQFRDGVRSTPLPQVVLTDADAAADLKGTPRPDNPTPEAAKKQKAEKAAPAPAPAPAAEPAASAPTAAFVLTAAPAVLYEKSGLPEKIAAAVGGGKRAEIVALLAKFGAKKGGELKPDQFQAFGAELDALAEPALS